MFPFLYGKVLHPQGDFIVSSFFGLGMWYNPSLISESLAVKGKYREYYRLNNFSYLVSGPSVVTLYARLAVPKNEKGIHSFSIKSSLSNAHESIHQFYKKVDSSVSSPLHPMHRYTKSAKIDIEIPKGEFILSVENESNIGDPILIRVIQQRRKN